MLAGRPCAAPIARVILATRYGPGDTSTTLLGAHVAEFPLDSPMGMPAKRSNSPSKRHGAESEATTRAATCGPTKLQT